MSLPKKVSWFRLPEYVAAIYEAAVDNTAVKLLALDSEDQPVYVEKSSLAADPAAAVDDVDTADGSDAATTQALANANKAKINELLVSLRAAGFLEEGGGPS
tara:strand:+ start:706 stop:1011 length:306 start_codon:yes stop_codon:yes gene_type:complete